MGNMSAILIGQYIKGLNNSLSNPTKFVTGLATQDAKEPFTAKAKKIISNWMFDFIFQRFFSFSITTYLMILPGLISLVGATKDNSPSSDSAIRIIP